MIEWKDGAVCFAGGLQFRDWDYSRGELITTDNESVLDFETCLSFKDFQLNEIREGDYIEASELDAEQKYNDAVEAFGLFGYKDGLSYSENVNEYKYDALFITNIEIDSVTGEVSTKECCKRKITYPQLMAIGKLKRAMIERDEVERGKLNHSVRLESPPLDVSGFNTVEQSREKRARRNKSKQAYEILKSLDYEYDLVKQRWYKKAYI